MMRNVKVLPEPNKKKVTMMKTLVMLGGLFCSPAGTVFFSKHNVTSKFSYFTQSSGI